MFSAADYNELRSKGYTHSLIADLLRHNPQRLQEMVEDPWRYPVLGDPSAPVEVNRPADPHAMLTRTENDVMRLPERLPLGSRARRQRTLDLLFDCVDGQIDTGRRRPN
jgi:hypothetical protein